MNAYLHWVNITGNAHQTCFLLLNKSGDCVDTLAHAHLALGRLVFFTSGPGSGTLTQPLLPGSLTLRTVLVNQAEKFSG